ncbi:poly [ADP-ribose] polymerase-like isoform X2 [Cotesia glomerata]|uniref:poly [ADP-ribose] polymerase-like isoform X2 n=1 Tax=Cotesia glomerata TaxID=32391 RepID=UPI001D02B377|nr:poly [ADP-ribose] polymerase-like isoform X2 [Cotesia glomerata]
MSSLKVNNENIWQLSDNIDQQHLRLLIANCAVFQEQKFIYTDHRRNFSVTFIKSSVQCKKLFYHYYRVQILEPGFRGREVKKYDVEESWGTFESSDHRRHSEKYDRDTAVSVFQLYTSEFYVNDKFSMIISVVEKKILLDFALKNLLKDIINYNFIIKVIKEHELVMKNIKEAFLRIRARTHKGSQPVVLADEKLAKIMTDEDPALVTKIIKTILDGIDEFYSTTNSEIINEAANFWNAFYKKLGAKIEVLDLSTDFIKIVQKSDDIGLFMDQIGNKKLLWHGTKTENIASILSEGFKVPHKPSHGRMFGHGIYFSNSVSKAANYCGCNRENSEGYLLLCEVALGNTMELYEAETDTWMLPLGIHSIVGKGLFSPYSNDKAIVYQDVEVPYGEIVKNVFSPNTTLLHDEFIVFNTSQIRIRHLVAVKFYFKKLKKAD